MHDFIDNVTQNLNLSSYQASKVKSNYDKYNVSRLEKRGGLLYAPYIVHGFWGRISRALFGVRADLIGQNETILSAHRNIKFGANGYHCVKIGRYTYYADSTGKTVSYDDYVRGIGN